MREKILLVAFVISLIINGIYASGQLETSRGQEVFPYLSKRIFAENQNDILINFVPLRHTIQNYVQAQNGTLGVYFEYLPSGVSIGANAMTEIYLTSLSKVPLAMSIMKKIERKEMAKDAPITIRADQLMSEFGDLWKSGAGTTMSVDELLHFMLAGSDNTAYKVLFDLLTREEIAEVYENLDIPLFTGEGHLLVSPKSYSSIFRSLYLSSFLTIEDSNYILDILTQSNFNDKIVAGVPNNVTVSHKIGVFEEENSSKNVFIDCGIVYVPSRPYILCAFVLDTDEQAQKHISSVSRLVYEYIVSLQ